MIMTTTATTTTISNRGWRMFQSQLKAKLQNIFQSFYFIGYILIYNMQNSNEFMNHFVKKSTKQTVLMSTILAINIRSIEQRVIHFRFEESLLVFINKFKFMRKLLKQNIVFRYYLNKNHITLLSTERQLYIYIYICIYIYIYIYYNI